MSRARGNHEAPKGNKSELAKTAASLIGNVAALLKVKTLVTLIVMSVWAMLVITGREVPESVSIVVTAVIAFYFGTQHESNKHDGL